MRNLLCLVVIRILLILALFASTAAASDKYHPTITIKVVEPTGAPVPQARIAVFSPAENKLVTKITPATGTVSFEVSRGTFDVGVSAQGFVEVRRSITVEDREDQVLAIGLKVGASSGPEVTPTTAAPPKVPISADVPQYPSLARSARIEGTVQLVAITDGFSVIEVKASGAHLLLMDAAERNFRSWRFAPHAPTTLQITYVYRLGKTGEPAVSKVTFTVPLRVEVTASAPDLQYQISD